MYVSGVLCELARAFDNVYNELLLFKLKYYGTRKKSLDSFKVYFVNRKTTELLESSYTHNFISNWEIVKHEVPQVSVLDSLIFNICTLMISDYKLIQLMR
jgi:hypothetical protein